MADRRSSVPLYLGYWPVQRAAFLIEVKWAQYTYSQGYLPRFPTVFFGTSTPAIIRVLRRACTVTPANDVLRRGGGYHTPPPQGRVVSSC